MDAALRPECLDGTRIKILEFIGEWLKSPLSNRRILCVKGVAGSGKSTISTTVARALNQSLGAFIFFDRNDPNNNDPAKVIRTLAFQLAQYHPLIKSAISEQIKPRSTTSISSLGLLAQFQTLIL